MIRLSVSVVLAWASPGASGLSGLSCAIQRVLGLLDLLGGPGVLANS